VHAQEPKSPRSRTGDAEIHPNPFHHRWSRREIKIDVESSRTSVTTTEPATGAPSCRIPSGDAGDDASGRRDGRPASARVTIDGIGTDREFDSFDEFVHDEPAPPRW
jgi:hypothetical protein